MTTIDKLDGYQMLTEDKAESIAARLNANATEDASPGEAPWKYYAVHGTRYSVVEVYDETGEYLGKL